MAGSEESIIERSRWLISLRWIAIAGVILAATTAGFIFKIPLPILPFCVITAVLIVYNLIFTFLITRLRDGFANLQISLDLACLAALIHFSGGIENPFLFYFIFHMIIASILLTRRASFLQATFAVLLFSIMVSLEYFAVLPHHSLPGFIPHTLHNNLVYISGLNFAFISTIYIAVYMATSISMRLR